MSFLKDLGLLFYIAPINLKAVSVDELPDCLTKAIPYFFLLIIVEFFYGKLRSHKFYNFKDTVQSVSLSIVQVLFGIFIKELVLIPYQWLFALTAPYRLQFIEKYVPDLLTLSERDLYICYYVIGFLGVDLGYYLFHRFAHEWHILWASHSVHHSGERYNFATALRQGMFQQCASWAFYLPLAALGLPMAEFIRHNRLNTIFQYWIHTETIGRLPWVIELIFNTASHHRMHHRPPGNCNYAGVLIVWDRLFGTFEPECGWPKPQQAQQSQQATTNNNSNNSNSTDYPRGVIYGLAKPLNNYDPVYPNLQHMLRMSDPSRGDNTSENAPWLVRSVLRLRKFVTMCFKKRVHHPWRLVCRLSEFAPDVLYDIQRQKPWLYALFRLPPNVEPIEQSVVLDSDCDSSGKSGVGELIPPVAAVVVAVDGLTARDVEFIRGRALREGKPLTATRTAIVVIQFLMTLALSLLLMLNHDHVVETQVAEKRGVVITFLATFAGIAVLSLQLIKLQYV